MCSKPPSLDHGPQLIVCEYLCNPKPARLGLPTKTARTLSLVARKPKPGKTRPKQGALLYALRRAAGLTQVDLAKFVGVPQGTITLWEWSDKPPRSDVLPKMARALSVSVDALLADGAVPKPSKKLEPVGEVQKAFDEVRRLPRKQQRKVVEMVTAFVEMYKRKAS
jgi:transcriptional regulator with XRE-family HTH domain